MAGRGGGGGDGGRGVGRRRKSAWSVAIDEAQVSNSQCRQGSSVALGLVVRDDGQWCRGHGQSAGGVGDAVVDVNCGRGGDGVRAAGDVAGRGGGGGDARRRVGQAGEGGRSVAVDQAGVAHCQRRQRRAVDLGLLVSGDGQRRRGDGQGAGGVADAVVAIGCACGGDGVGAAGDVAGGGGGGRDRWLRSERGRGVAVHEPRVAGGQRRQGRSIDLGLVDNGDGQGGRADGQAAGDVAD